MKNKIEDLRNILFSQLEKLHDTEGDDLENEINRSASMVQVAESILKAGEVELQFYSVTGTTTPIKESLFLKSSEQ